MKAGLLSIVGFSAIAAAVPAAHRHHHDHAKRQDVVYDVETQVQYVTATAADAVVVVDGSGKVLYTSYASQAAATSTSESSSTYVAPPSSSSSSVYVAPTTSSTPSPATYAAAVATSSAAASSDAETRSSSGTAPTGFGLSYSPYNSDNSCKTQDQVNADFAKISDASLIRIYGTDCNQFSTVYTAVKANNMQLFAGVYDITQTAANIQTIIDTANGDWDNLHTVSIGNEGVNMGKYTVDAVVAAIGLARTMLNAAGYKGNVVTVDTFVAIISNPELCQASDYAAANCHAFFDGGVTAQQAGKFVLGQAQRVSQACGGKDTMITESGWPWQGETNGKAVPSPQNQKDAIASLKAHFSSNLVLFTAFNDYWKQNNAGTYGAEQYWGLLGDAPSS